MMKKIFRLFSFLLIAAVFSSSSIAQESSEGIGGSVYSLYGIGLPQDVTSHNFKGQGLLGVSGITLEITSLANPALWNRSYFTQASTGLQLDNHTAKNSSASNSSSSLTSGYLHLLLPVSVGKLGLSLSLYPVTRSNFSVVTDNELNTGAETIAYSSEIQNTGGVNKFEAGFGLKLTDNLSFGYAPAIAFMTLRSNEQLLFNSSIFNAQDQSLDVTGATFSQRFGLAASFKNLFKKDDRISLGATLNLPYSLNGTGKFTSEKVVEGTVQTVDLSNSIPNTSGQIELPLETSFGLGYGPSRFVNFAVEGTYQKWSNYRNELETVENVSFTDRLKIGVGGQFHPYKRNSSAFLSNFKYSAGLSYDTGHLNIEGNDINTLWINTGLGIIARNAAPIDISFQYGFRGTTDNNLIKERIWSLGFSINLNELMFIRPKLK